MKTLKRFAKYTALVFAVLLSLYSCQKDDAVTLESNDSHQHEHSSTTKSVSASEIPRVMQFLESKSNNRLEFVIDDSNSELGMHRIHEENLSMTTALVDQIKMVTNSYGRSNYTFKLIEEETRAGVYFLNLIVKEHKDEFYVFIMKYVPSEAWLNTFTDTSPFSSYSGDIYFYDHNGVYAGITTLVNGQTTSSDSREPCPPDIDHNSPTNTTSSSTTTVSASTESSTSSSSSTSNGSVGGLDDLSAGFGWLCNWRGQLHPSPNDCNNPGQGGTWTIQVDYGNEDRSMRDLTDCPRVSGECYQSNGDPCPNGCDEDGYCIDEQEEIESSEIDINVDVALARYNNFYGDLTSEQQGFLDAHSNIELDIQQFLSENGLEVEGVIIDIINALMENSNLSFEEAFVYSELNSIMHPNDSFVIDNTINPDEALHFETAEEFEEYINTFSFDSVIDVIDNQDGTHTTTFKVDYFTCALNINISQKLQNENIDQDYEIVNLSTILSGFTLGASWNQSSYDYTVYNNVAYIDLYGYLNYDFFMEGVGTVYSKYKHYKMRVDIETGQQLLIENGEDD